MIIAKAENNFINITPSLKLRVLSCISSDKIVTNPNALSYHRLRKITCIKPQKNAGKIITKPKVYIWVTGQRTKELFTVD